jgi:mono/diheme cytochrome c family protein
MQMYLLKDLARRGDVKDVMAPLMKRAGAAIKALGLLTIGALIAGCGSGGGGGDGAGASPQVVSGVAATGSPLAGGQVTLRDSASVRNEKVGEIDNNGSFAINVADMTAPFILKATGTADGVSRTMFSFADKPGIANINPFSSVALANAAGVDDPADVFDKSDSAMLDKVKSGMSGSVANLRSKLKPLLDEFSAGSANPVSDRFEANHEGLDAVFDNVKVVIANGILTITNVDTGVVLFTARVKDLEGRFNDNDDDVPKHGRPRPAAPTGVTTVGGGPGSNQVTVSWDPVANATSYDLFYTTASKAAEDDDHEGEDSKKRIKNVTSPFVVTGLDPATTYFFIVRARIDGRKGPRSAEVPGTPSSTTPSTAPTTSTTSTTTGATTSTTAGATTSSTGATTSSMGATTTTTVLPPPTTTTTTTAPTTTTTTTTATTTSTTLAPPAGLALYNANCSGCHVGSVSGNRIIGTSPNIQGTSAAATTIAIANNTGNMGFINLTQAQIAAIVAVLQ